MGLGALQLVGVLARKCGDAAHVLHQVEDDAFAAQEGAGVVADDGEGLAVVGADAVEDLGMADDFVARLRVSGAGKTVEAAEDFKDARDAAEAGDDQLLAREDGGCGAQVGIDGEAGGGVARSFVFDERLLEEGVDAAIFPVHLGLLPLLVALAVVGRYRAYSGGKFSRSRFALSSKERVSSTCFLRPSMI